MQGGRLTLDHCGDMDGSAAMEGGVPLPQRVSIFYDFFTLKFSPVKFVQPLGGVVQIKCVYDFFTHNLAKFVTPTLKYR